MQTPFGRLFALLPGLVALLLACGDVDAATRGIPSQTPSFVTIGSLGQQSAVACAADPTDMAGISIPTGTIRGTRALYYDLAGALTTDGTPPAGIEFFLHANGGGAFNDAASLMSGSPVASQVASFQSQGTIAHQGVTDYWIRRSATGSVILGTVDDKANLSTFGSRDWSAGPVTLTLQMDCAATADAGTTFQLYYMRVWYVE